MNDDNLSQRRRLAKLEARIATLEGARLNVIEVERLELNPDDVLFVHVADDTAPEEMDEVARIIAEHLGTRRVLILAGATTVSVGTLPADGPTRTLSAVPDPQPRTPAPEGPECAECGWLDGQHAEACPHA